jgi:hypothetical protein
MRDGWHAWNGWWEAGSSRSRGWGSGSEDGQGWTRQELDSPAVAARTQTTPSYLSPDDCARVGWSAPPVAATRCAPREAQRRVAFQDVGVHPLNYLPGPLAPLAPIAPTAHVQVLAPKANAAMLVTAIPPNAPQPPAAKAPSPPLLAAVAAKWKAPPPGLPSAVARRARTPQLPLDIAHFQSIRADITRPCKQHNTAMKWIRQYSEGNRVNGVQLTVHDPMLIPQIIHHAGALYDWVLNADGLPDADTAWPWCWKHMVAQMDDASMELVVLGPDGSNRSRGIVDAWIQKSTQYDHKRHSALKKERRPQPEDMLYEWYFVLTRSDGTQCGVRPNYNNNKILYTADILDVIPVDYRGGDAEVAQELPMSGKGGTSGKGTYKQFKMKHQSAYLKFDGRIPRNPTPM